ncbi:MAG: sphingomyelin phosphodiesterase [Flavobacteriales bacterium]|nr:sphingomyelin phosphodiesterase [Flavobacteriales bacterium]
MKTILFALLIAHCSNLIAQEQTLNSTPSELSAVSGTLKVLSYNIHMLPPLAKFTGKQRRAKRIGDILKDSDFDIVVFQEAFHAAARRKIKHRMKANYPHILGPANRRWYSLKTNSGIWILSKIPLTQVAELDFDYCEGIDCWARKGALVAEGEFNGQTFQILGTHLEAGGSREKKVEQYREIDIVLTQVRKKNVPQIIAGDFNTKKFQDTTWYNQLVNILGAEDGPLLSEQQYSSDSFINDIKIQRGDKNKRGVIDFVFYRSNGENAKINRYVRMPRWQWSKNCQDLSDHFAIEAQIQFLK